MSSWKAVYRSKLRRPEDERFACTQCEKIWDGSHSKGPPNGVCQCSACMGKTVSDGYREGWERIWGTKS